MSMMTFWFVPMLPELKGGTETSTTLPAALAEAEVETPVVCCRNPGKLKSDVPLKRCWNAPLALQSIVIRPLGPPNVKKLGLPLVLVARWSCWPPPERSLLGISPLPCIKVQKKNASHCSMKYERNVCGLLVEPPRLTLNEPKTKPPPDVDHCTNPEVPFETKCDWFPGPPPPPPVSLTVARLGRGPAAWAAGVVAESWHPESRYPSADAAHTLAKRTFIGASWLSGSVGRLSQAPVKQDAGRREAKREFTRDSSGVSRCECGRTGLGIERLRPRQPQSELKPASGIRRQLPREVDRQIDRRQEGRQVAEPEPRLRVGPARREQQRVAGVGRMAVEGRPEHAAVHAQGEWQASDQREPAPGEQQPVEVVAQGDHGGATPRIVRIARRGVEPACLERQRPHPEIHREVALRRDPPGREASGREQRRDPQIERALPPLDQYRIAPVAEIAVEHVAGRDFRAQGHPGPGEAREVYVGVLAPQHRA